jgi:hypothetical protein
MKTDNKKQKVCATCKHFDEKYDCKKAELKYGTDGYGPWRGNAVCINDPYFKNPENLYESVSEEDYSELKKMLGKVQDDLISAKYKIKSLSLELAHRIAEK